jgi:hypothetical protein
VSITLLNVTRDDEDNNDNDGGDGGDGGGGGDDGVDKDGGSGGDGDAGALSSSSSLSLSSAASSSSSSSTSSSSSSSSVFARYHRIAARRNITLNCVSVRQKQKTHATVAAVVVDYVSDESNPVDLLVIASRGLGLVDMNVLGSVCDECVHDAAVSTGSFFFFFFFFFFFVVFWFFLFFLGLVVNFFNWI